MHTHNIVNDITKAPTSAPGKRMQRDVPGDMQYVYI